MTYAKIKHLHTDTDYHYRDLTLIKFLPPDFVGVSHNIPQRNKNAVYQPFARICLSSKSVSLKKGVKLANEMTDDVIHSTQYHIKCINRTILVNLQHRQ